MHALNSAGSTQYPLPINFFWDSNSPRFKSAAFVAGSSQITPLVTMVTMVRESWSHPVPSTHWGPWKALFFRGSFLISFRRTQMSHNFIHSRLRRRRFAAQKIAVVFFVEWPQKGDWMTGSFQHQKGANSGKHCYNGLCYLNKVGVCWGKKESDPRIRNENDRTGIHWDVL